MKKKTIFLGAFLASASLMLLAGCGKKNTNNKNDNTTTSVVTSGDDDTSTSKTKTSTDSSHEDEDTYVDDSLFNNSLLRINVVDNKIDTIEQFGMDYTIYMPVYDSNNKISFFRVFSNDTNFRDRNDIGSCFYQVELDDLLADLVFHYDSNDNFSIIETKNKRNRVNNVINDGYVNKVTFSKDGKITKDLSAQETSWECYSDDNMITFTGNPYPEQNIQYIYEINDSFDMEMTTLQNDETSASFKMERDGEDILYTYDSKYYYEKLRFKFVEGALTEIINTPKGAGEATSTEYHYNADGKITAIHVKGTTRVLSVEYGLNGKILSETYDSYKTQYIYDSKNVCVGSKDSNSTWGNSNEITQYNDDFQPLVKMENGGHGKQSHEYTYDEKGRQLSYQNYYYTNPTSEDRFLAYETSYRYNNNGVLIEDISYSYDNSGNVTNGNKIEYLFEGNKTITKYYGCAGVKGVFNLVSERSYEETEDGSISEATSYNGTTKAYYEKVTVSKDLNGNRKEVTKQIEYNTDGSEKTVTDITKGTLEDDDSVTYVSVYKNGNLYQNTYVEWTDFNEKSNVVTYTYDQTGEAIHYKEESTYEYDGTDLVAIKDESYEYENGNIASYQDLRRDMDGEVYYQRDVEYTYDSKNLIKAIDEEISKLNDSDEFVTERKFINYLTNQGTNTSSQKFDYYEVYSVDDDDNKTALEGVQITYNARGLASVERHYKATNGVIPDDYTSAKWYTYDEFDNVGLISIYEDDGVDGLYLKESFVYDEDGNLLSSEIKNDDTNVVVETASYDANGKEVITYEYETDAYGYQMIRRTYDYYKLLFGEYVLYEKMTETESAITTIVEGSSDKIKIGEQRSGHVIEVDIYSGSSRLTMQYSEIDRDTYVDGTETKEGYTSRKETYYNQQGKFVGNSYVKKNLDSQIVEEYTTEVTYTDVETDVNTRYLYENEVLTTTIIETRKYDLTSRDESSAEKTVIDHTNNDDTRYYRWDYELGDWIDVFKIS